MSRKQNKRSNSEKNRNNKRSKSRNKKSSEKKDSNNSESKNDRSKMQSMDKMKYEIANEFGINLGPEAFGRKKGQVVGEMTKRSVEISRKNKKCN